MTMSRVDVKDIFHKNNIITQISTVFYRLIKDTKFVKETIAQKLSYLLDAYGTKVKNLPAVHKEVNDYLMKGIKTPSLMILLKVL